MNTEYATIGNTAVEQAHYTFESRLSVFQNLLSIAKTLDEEINYQAQTDIGKINKYINGAVYLTSQEALKVRESNIKFRSVLESFVSLPFIDMVIKPETLKNVKNLIKIVIKYNEVLETIATNEEVDENSKDYTNFVKDLMDEVKPNNVGKDVKELFAD